MRPIIQVRSLSKRYRIGAQRARYGSLRESLTSWVRQPFQVLRKKGRQQRPTIWALKDVTFDVMPGEVLGVIGRNGAGKSTLLKVLSRITEPTEGEVDLFGRVGSLLEVGTGFHPELTGRENIFLNGAVLGMTKAEIDRKFDEIVTFAEIERFVDTPVKHYSSGMYVRLAFAVAAHLEPEILLVDEVLAVGDAAFQKKCLGKMGEVANQGRTVLLVSHNMNAIQELCTTAILLESGKVRRVGRDVRSVTREYLFGARDQFQRSEWVNDSDRFGGRAFRPLRFAVCREDGSAVCEPIPNYVQVWVQIEAQIDEVDPSLTVGYAVHSQSGELLYWSYHTDADPVDWPKLGRGRVVLQSPLPRRLFNEGTYRVELIGGLHFRGWFFEPGGDGPSVFLTIQGGLSNSPMWMQKRPGLLAPVIGWTLKNDIP